MATPKEILKIYNLAWFFKVFIFVPYRRETVNFFEEGLKRIITENPDTFVELLSSRLMKNHHKLELVRFALGFAVTNGKINESCLPLCNALFENFSEFTPRVSKEVQGRLGSYYY